MKLHINYTENWDEIDDHIKEVEKFFEPLGLQITSSYIPLAELPDSFFESHLSWSGLRIIKTRSIKNSIIKAMGQIKNPDADWYGIYVDKKKVNNAFDGIANAGVLEVYGKRTNVKKEGMNYNVYTLCHEILHLYELDMGLENELHKHISNGGTLVEFRDMLLGKQKKSYKHLTEKMVPLSEMTKKNNKPEYIIVHHTGGSQLNPLEDTSHHTFETVQLYHINLGWENFGYHWFIEKNGKIRQGRPEHYHGSHAIGYNKKSVGICLAGNFDATLPTDEQVKSLKMLLEAVKTRHNIPLENIIPHRHVAKKSCYGNNLSDDWARNLLKPDCVPNNISALAKALLSKLNPK